MADMLVEGVDYYMENGFMVFTEHYLRRRGYCCQSGCRHCPYGFKAKSGAIKSSDQGGENKQKQGSQR